MKIPEKGGYVMAVPEPRVAKGKVETRSDQQNHKLAVMDNFRFLAFETAICVTSRGTIRISFPKFSKIL